MGTATSEQNRLAWVDAARGFAILLVVLYHAIQWSASAGYDSDLWHDVSAPISTLRMPLFFTLSGILAAKWVRRPWRELLGSKVASLLWLYLVWQTITIGVYMLVPNVSTPGKSNFAEVATGLVSPLRPEGALWFIWALALFFVICRATINRAPRGLLIGTAAVVATLSFGGVVSLGNVGWDGALDNFVFFALGATCSPVLRTIGDRMTITIAVGAVVAWVAFVAFVPFWETAGWNILSRGLGLAAGIGIGVLLSRVSVLCRIGRNTLLLYLPHYLALTVLAFCASAAPLPNSSATWLPFGMFGGALAVCALISALPRHVQPTQVLFRTPATVDTILRGWAYPDARKAPSELP